MNRNPTVRPAALLARILLASAAMMTTMLVGSTAARAAAASAADFAEIRNVRTGLCIQPLANVESALVQVECKPNNRAQRWAFVLNGYVKGFGVYHIVNQRSGLCMYMDGPVASGSPVIQTGCSAVSNENWRNSTPPWITSIESMAGHDFTELCLAPQSLAAGALLRVFRCNRTNVQQWVIGAQSA